MITYKQEGVKSPLTIVIAHYNQKRAKDLFKRFADINRIKYDEQSLIVKKVRKNALNKRFFSEEYIQKQEEYIKRKEGE